MGWDGSGGYNRERNFSADASAGIRILASAMDQEVNDIASAMQNCLARDGQNTPTADIPLGGFRLVNGGQPASATDYIRVQEVINEVPIFMEDTASSADRISASSQFFTGVSATNAPADGVRIKIRAFSNKSSAVMYLDGFSANIEYQDGNRIGAAMVSGGIYEFTYSSSDTSWKIHNPDDGRTAAEIAAGVTPTNYQYPTATTLDIPQRYDLSYSINRDQHRFEQLLSFEGAVFNGSTDDSGAIQNALNGMISTSYLHHIRFPSGNLTARIDSGLTLQAGGHSIDFQGLQIDASNMTSGYALTVNGITFSPFNVENTAAPISNLILTGPTSQTGTVGGIFVGRNTTDAVSNMGFYNIMVQGFRDSIEWGNWTWLTHFFNCQFYDAYRYGLHVNAATNAGENLAFFGGSIANVRHATAGTGKAIYMADNDFGDNEVYLHGVSLDYCDQIADIQGGHLSLHGCHIEDDSDDNAGGAASAVLINIQHNSGNQPSGLSMYGGKISLTDGTSRTSMITIDGSKAFCRLDTALSSDEHPSEWITQTNNAFVNVDGTVWDSENNDSTVFPTISSALNRLGNPGAEAGALTGWTTNGTGHTWTADTGVVDVGTYSIKTVSVSGNTGWCYQLIPVRPGQRIVAKGRLNVTSISAGSFSYDIWYYADSAEALSVGTQNIGAAITATTGGWVSRAEIHQVPAGANYARVGVIGSSFTGTAYADELELYVC